MSTPWNASCTSNENSRPRILHRPMLACQTCNQIFLNFHSLLQHHESHVNELNQRPQNHQTNVYLSSLRESGVRNLNNNPFQSRLSSSFNLQQRYHPYLSNGFRMLQYERSSNPQNNLVLASTQTHNLQPRHPVAINNALGAPFQILNRTSVGNVADSSPFAINNVLGASFQFPNRTSEGNVADSSPFAINNALGASFQFPNRTSEGNVADSSPFAINNALGASFQFPNRTSEGNVADSSPFLIQPPMPSAQQVSIPKEVPVLNSQEWKGQNESADTKTVWYLSQLEKPIPQVIDLERDDELHENLKLDLTISL